jgi:hypothetical protein
VAKENQLPGRVIRRGVFGQRIVGEHTSTVVPSLHRELRQERLKTTRLE